MFQPKPIAPPDYREAYIALLHSDDEDDFILTIDSIPDLTINDYLPPDDEDHPC